MGAVVLLLLPGGDDAPQPRRTSFGSATGARVIRVVDGDTAIVEFGGRRDRLRYIGIDAPESVKPEAPVECYGPQAARLNRRLVEGHLVTLRFDAERRDRFGRLLAYVHAGGRFVNAELVRSGAARTLVIAPNTAHAAELAQLEKRARAKGRGLWTACEDR